MAKFKLFGREGLFAKIGRRNLIIIGAVIAVGAAVAVNYAVFYARPADDVGYGEKTGQTSTVPQTEAEKKAAAVATYFTSAQLSRQQAREEALAVLQSVADSDDALEATRAQALTDIAKIAEDIRSESNVEALVKAKGFDACVAVLSGDKISVIVSCDTTLTQNQVAQINEIVYSQTGIVPANVNVIQK